MCIILTNFVELKSSVLYTLFQIHRPLGSGEDDF